MNVESPEGTMQPNRSGKVLTFAKLPVHQIYGGVAASSGSWQNTLATLMHVVGEHHPRPNMGDK